MAANALETVGDAATLGYSQSGTLTAGTLTSGTWSGTIGGAVLAVGAITPFARIYDIEPNKVQVKQVETTKLASAADESQPGTPDYGEVGVTIPYTNATTTLINGWIANKTLLFFQMTVDDFAGGTDSAESFLGWCKEWTPLSESIKKDETAKGKLTIKITGVPLFAAGS